MAQIQFNPTPKQALAYIYLTDNKTTEIGYGGGAGGGKSWLGCFWIISQALRYPGTTWLIGRKELINLKRTTLVTFFKVCQEYGITNNYFNFNQQENIIRFYNGSVIYLMDTAYKPNDPLNTRFGSLELTGAFVDESNESPLSVINIIKTRLGRGKNKEYNLIPKILETFNPDKNHVYMRYYKPSKDKTLPNYRAFIKALVTDNNYLDDLYVNQLRNSDNITRERLLLGNFEYDDDPAILCDYDALCDMFTNNFVPSTKVRYITSDIAMKGRDNFIITLWDGLRCKIPVIMSKSSGPEIVNTIDKCSFENNVARTRIVCDTDGMGGFLESFKDANGRTHEGFLRDIKSFHNGAKAIRHKDYANLKSDCAFKLAELVNKREIYIECDESIREQIILEFQQLKQDKLDDDLKKKSIISKEQMKENLGGKSPDLLDCFIMRMIFEIRGEYIPTIA